MPHATGRATLDVVRQLVLGIGFALISLAIAASCSSFGTETSTHDASVADAPLTDTGAEAVDAGAVVVRDGSFCSGAGAHDHCWDFTPTDVQTDWHGENILQDGSILRDTTEFTSGPASLRTEALARKQQSAGRLVRVLATPTPGTYSLSFSIWKECNVQPRVATFVELYCRENAPILRVEPLGPDKIRVVTIAASDDNNRETAALETAAPDGRWVRVEIVATYGDPGLLKVRVNGVERTAEAGMLCPGIVELLLGAQGNFETGTCVARFDDVILDVP
jgi:hypothetical protein